MAPKDYVSRSKKNHHAKKTTSAPRRPVKRKKAPKWYILFFLWAIIGFFVMGLYWLKFRTPPAVSVTTKSPARSVNKPTITPPKQRWDYIQNLVDPDNPKNNRDPKKIVTAEPATISPEQQQILAMMAADRPITNETTSTTYNQYVARDTQKGEAAPAHYSPIENSKPLVETEQKISLQCGAFRQETGAESVKAQLALLGITSHIHYNNNLYCVRISGFPTRTLAEKSREQIKNNQSVDCQIKLEK